MKNRILLNEVSGIVTTDRGLEPLLTESESAVLPLHQSASSVCSLWFSTANKFIIANLYGNASIFLHFFKESHFKYFFFFFLTFSSKILLSSDHTPASHSPVSYTASRLFHSPFPLPDEILSHPLLCALPYI